MTPPEDRERSRTPEGTALLMKTWSDGEAEVVRRLLDYYGIPCQVISDITHTLYPFSVDGLGEIRILVPESSLAEASELIAQHRRDGLEAADNGDPSDAEAPPAEPGESPSGRRPC